MNEDYDIEVWVAHLKYHDGYESELHFQVRDRTEKDAVLHAENHMNSTGGGTVISVQKQIMKG